MLTNSREFESALRRFDELTAGLPGMQKVKFLSLSKPSHKFLIVNATIVNSCMYFIDPLNMTIIDSIFINTSPELSSQVVQSELAQAQERMLKLAQARPIQSII